MTPIEKLAKLVDEMDHHVCQCSSCRMLRGGKTILALTNTILKLVDEGDQMYRAIVYTSGVSLNYAADEWAKSRAALCAAIDREIRRFAI